jgi:hypothetical protein
MNLLKIGSEYINLDLVIDITDYIDAEYNPQNKMLVEFVGRNSSDYSWTTFEGDEAAALRSYLTNTAIDVMKPYRAAQTQEPAIVVGACECSACSKEVR